MSQRALRSTVKKNVESEECTTMESSSTARNILLKKSLRIREQNLIVGEKENRADESSEAFGNSLRQLKAFWEDKSITEKNVPAVPVIENTKSTGAIKKRTKSVIECRESKNSIILPDILADTSENDIFQKSRFKIYDDESKKRISKNRGVERLKETSEEIVANKSSAAVAQDKIILGLSPRPKKVKVSYGYDLTKKTVESDDTQEHASLYSESDVPYDDYIIECELERERSTSSIPTQFRQRNITDEQRKIIVKFLIRLNCHMFHPSYYLYQTVKLFDAILDTKIIKIEDLQLNALAAMWIVLKREHIVDKIPTAETMISFSKDLYEGKTDLLLKCERKILQTLNFNTVFPNPFSVLSYYLTEFSYSRSMSTKQLSTAYYCAGYMIDLSLLDQDLMKISAILLAAVAAEVAAYFTMVDEQDSSTTPLWFIWRTPHVSRRFNEEVIAPVRSTLIRKIFKSAEKHSEGDIVFKKYSRSRYGRISHFLGDKVRSYLHSE